MSPLGDSWGVYMKKKNTIRVIKRGADRVEPLKPTEKRLAVVERAFVSERDMAAAVNVWISDRRKSSRAEAREAARRFDESEGS